MIYEGKLFITYKPHIKGALLDTGYDRHTFLKKKEKKNQGQNLCCKDLNILTFSTG